MNHPTAPREVRWNCRSYKLRHDNRYVAEDHTELPHVVTQAVLAGNGSVHGCITVVDATGTLLPKKASGSTRAVTASD